MVSTLASVPEADDETVMVEKNYETECTPLYNAIESVEYPADWKKVTTLLKEDDTPIQARIWVTRFDAEDKNKVKWSQLPLHLAIVCQAPFEVIETLVQMYPQALQCTDDQHMLPLHLALRHGSSDDVVVLFLNEFPEAVNAKGKNGRTAVDCALRAKDKTRGRMLELFVEKTRSCLSKNVLRDRSTMKAELGVLKAELESQYKVMDKFRAEVSQAQADVREATHERIAAQADLFEITKELERRNAFMTEEEKEQEDELKTIKLTEVLDLRHKVDELEQENKQLELDQIKAREESEDLRQELSAVQEIVNSNAQASPKDWLKMKREVEMIRAYNLDKAREETQREYAGLKLELERTIQAAKATESMVKTELHDELYKIKKSVDQLQPDDKSLRTRDDMAALRSEVSAMKADIKSRANASKTKVELSVLKKAMEMELRETEGKTQEELETLRRAIALANTDGLHNKTTEEMALVKAELSQLKKEMSLFELANKTKKDVDDLRASMKSLLSETGGSKPQWALEKKLKTINSKISKAESKEVIALQPSVNSLKAEMKKLQACARVQEKAASLKEAIDKSLKGTQGKTNDRLSKLKKQTKSLVDGLDKKDTKELIKIEKSLAIVKDEYKEAKVATKIQHAWSDLSKAVNRQIEKATEATVKEVYSVKKALDAIDVDLKERKELKKKVVDDIKAERNAKEKDLLDIKKSLDAIDVKKIEVSDSDAWATVRKELQSLEASLLAKQVIEISAVEADILVMKKVVAAIGFESGDVREEVREEVEAMKANLERDLEVKANQAQLSAKNNGGVKHFLSRHFSSRSKGDFSDRSLSGKWSRFSSKDEDEIVKSSHHKVPSVVIPPALSNGASVDLADSSDNSESSGAKMSSIKMKRTLSKTVVQGNGEVELEAQ